MGVKEMYMRHSVEDFCKKISVMYDKSIQLHRERYGGGTGAVAGGEYDRKSVETLIEDIQSLAGDVYNDREPYEGK